MFIGFIGFIIYRAGSIGRIGFVGFIGCQGARGELTAGWHLGHVKSKQGVIEGVYSAPMI